MAGLINRHRFGNSAGNEPLPIAERSDLASIFIPDVMADHDAMVTVLVNLLDNAYKYSRNDRRVELRAFTRDGTVCFSVSDNGIGMSRSSAGKIFERFYQADRRLSRDAEGCGLGLSIAKFIVDAHEGSIDVESKSGEGSTFTIKLPAVKERHSR